MIDFIQKPDGQIDIDISNDNHAKDLIIFCKGWHKFFPFVGGCLREHISDEYAIPDMYSLIQREIESDGGALEGFMLLPGSDHTHHIYIKTNYG